MNCVKRHSFLDYFFRSTNVWECDIDFNYTSFPEKIFDISNGSDELCFNINVKRIYCSHEKQLCYIYAMDSFDTYWRCSLLSGLRYIMHTLDVDW